MPYLARPWSRESRRRAVAVRYAPAVLEALEERTMLSGTGASLATSDAMIASKTTMIDSTSTAVTGALVAFTATVENARTGAPITSGKFSFVVESPKKTVLQDVTVNSLGQATIGTKDLTDIANYKIVAQYIPTNSAISASTSAPLTIKVIPVPLNVPTATSLSSIGHTAEVGQYVPLVANVADAGTGTQVDAGLIEPLTGKVAFLTDSPNPIVLGEVTVNKDGQATLPTNMLKNLGTYQIIAEFLPFNNYYAQSTSAPISLTILPQTVDAPTVTTLQTSTGLIETGEPLQFTASVQNANSSLSGGVVELVTVSKHPQVLTEAPVGTFGTPLYFSSFKLQETRQLRGRGRIHPQLKSVCPEHIRPCHRDDHALARGQAPRDTAGPPRPPRQADRLHGHRGERRSRARDRLRRHRGPHESDGLVDRLRKRCTSRPRPLRRPISRRPWPVSAFRPTRLRPPTWAHTHSTPPSSLKKAGPRPSGPRRPTIPRSSAPAPSRSNKSTAHGRRSLRERTMRHRHSMVAVRSANGRVSAAIWRRATGTLRSRVASR